MRTVVGRNGRIVVVTILVAVSASWLVFAQAGLTGIISACASPTGAMRGSETTSLTCRAAETALSWYTKAGADAAFAPRGGSIAGTLSGCTPGTDFTGALVYIPGRPFNVFTDADGAFRIDLVPPGTYKLSIAIGGSILRTLEGVEVGTELVELGAILTVDTSSDPNNCGGCGISCGGGACENGVCAGAPSGTFCTVNGDCASGICADNVCCNSVCTGTCVSCAVAGSLGTCTPFPAGTDPGNECGPVSCVSFYYGWLGDTCYRKADVTGAEAVCSGAAACRNAAVECSLSSTRGPAIVTCNSICQTPNLGTCTGTTPGTCSNIDPGNQSCGTGACARTVAMCSNGIPVACVPGTPTAEVCGNNVDDDCDGQTDEGCGAAPLAIETSPPRK